ncbi:MAG: hypothetical protein DHS20C05_16890 [Hyphococcus sp.]|nr:MAG: hypothetical protein DHS20C05_16890 [Marinicaulis sp.]
MSTSACASSSEMEAPVEGPLRVCFNYSWFLLAQGESISDYQFGHAAMTIKVMSSLGTYTVGESSIFAPPELDRIVSKEKGTHVYLVDSQKPEYAIAGVTSFSNDEAVIVLLLDGDAFTGTEQDMHILKRFTVVDPTEVNCEKTYTYGWDLLFEN